MVTSATGLSCLSRANHRSHWRPPLDGVGWSQKNHIFKAHSPFILPLEPSDCHVLAVPTTVATGIHL
ncbi:hypothetical protein COLO4_28090 [Corchorus olitorius]|uniref:Uncharacterized protein n=1 Tax=Corchorus olitorius TaxID=93759 RepID=A0A1R3HN69_9ROSI|nr:hypothetical protein COLO4_28090 [Corchorus olitorius]